MYKIIILIYFFIKYSVQEFDVVSKYYKLKLLI